MSYYSLTLVKNCNFIYISSMIRYRDTFIIAIKKFNKLIKNFFFTDYINIKIIIYGLTMFSAYILPYESGVFMLFLFALYLMFLGALGNLIWAFAGNILKRFYSSHYKFMNNIMALLLVWCSLRITGLF